MKVYTPNEYPIEFSNEELISFRTTVKYLQEIREAMKANNCDTLEGGYAESPIFFQDDSIDNTIDWLEGFIEYLPCKMY